MWWAKMYFSRLVPTMGCFFFYSFVSFYFSCFGVDVPKDSEQPSRMAITNNSNNGWIIWGKNWEPEDLRFWSTLRAGNKWLGLPHFGDIGSVRALMR